MGISAHHSTTVPWKRRQKTEPLLGHWRAWLLRQALVHRLGALRGDAGHASLTRPRDRSWRLRHFSASLASLTPASSDQTPRGRGGGTPLSLVFVERGTLPATFWETRNDCTKPKIGFGSNHHLGASTLPGGTWTRIIGHEILVDAFGVN